MVFGLLKSNKKQTHQYWTTEESGYEKTTSEPLIKHLITHLKNKRTPLALVTSGYQSAPTVLIDATDEKLLLDKPIDWPETFATETGRYPLLRVVFKDAANKWNHFTARITGENDNTLYLSPPRKLYRLERRSYYRVAAPSGARLSFACGNNRYEQAILNDFSAGGMLFSLPGTADIKKAHLTDISITLPTDTQNDAQIRINKGEIVRSNHDLISRQIAFGVSFQITGKEEENLLRIVRQFELSQIKQQRH